MSNPQAPYVLGAAAAEQERLIRQAAIFDPLTERLFRDAGIGPGQRVLDVGSGVGDVAMLAARIVGSSGSITCVERDPTSLSRARSRAAEAGLGNVSFIEGNAENVTSDGVSTLRLADLSCSTWRIRPLSCNPSSRWCALVA